MYLIVIGSTRLGLISDTVGCIPNVEHSNERVVSYVLCETYSAEVMLMGSLCTFLGYSLHERI